MEETSNKPLRDETFVIAGTRLFALLALLALASCGKLDVVGTGSVKSFDQVLKQLPQAVTRDEANGGWSLAAPDNSARFIWSKNYAESPRYDVLLELDASPFIAAGLVPERLSGNCAFSGDKLLVGAKLGTEQLKYQGAAAPLASYEQLVKRKRGVLGYHMAMDHYGVNLGGGALFEWARDMDSNDKDIVFVLNPEPFIAAGVNPNAVAGWIFTKVTVDDENGKPLAVDKLLKPFDLK
jgi:hypothetical protein